MDRDEISDEKAGFKRVVLRPDVDVFDKRLLLPTRLIAKSFDVTIDAVIKWEIRPVEKIGREALLYLPEVIANRMGFGENGAPKLNPAQEKALLDRARRERAELELKKTRGELVAVEDVCKELEGELNIVRQKLLAIPSKLARKLVPMESAREIEDLIKSAITEALEALTAADAIPVAKAAKGEDEEEDGDA